MYRDGETAWGECANVSEYFADWLAKHGVRANVPWDEPALQEFPWTQEGRDPHPFDFGYSDRPQHPDPELEADPSSHDPNETHHVVIVRMPTGTYTVDFTAAQFGYNEFPMVQKRDESGGWQRAWDAPGTPQEPSSAPNSGDWTPGAGSR